ncbi:hypothetical protein [Brevibacillus laterosporus]|uniref:Uncharacterized protein n=1 Tax=Brevibacillus laterosporus TaxID=1465 RepID=A0AAP8Q869_BRELA|nr:hypothetical protein [Brevibacillus laterosporus]PPA90144.1 hypothetical protein C4A77_25330 [Brevibacillus laterosporus]
MAGTRGIARLRGEQFHNKIMRNNHFDSANKISETYLDIKFHNHREILEDTKIDVFVQANNKEVKGVSQIDVTADVGARSISTGVDVEGVVLTEKVQLRLTGSDTPIGDADSDVVYGRLEEAGGVFTLTFFSIENGAEQLYTFDKKAENIDYRFVIRTNLSVIPVDAIVKGGACFVEGATDARAYMNLVQLMKDIYGKGGTLDNDGNANLATSIVQQIADEDSARQNADKAIRDDFAATTGASLVGVVSDPNYTGLTVQTVLTDLAKRIKTVEHGSDKEVVDAHIRDVASKNGLFPKANFTSLKERLVEIENKTDIRTKELDDRILLLETEEEEEFYEAKGGETSYSLTKGMAKDKSVLVAINGQIQVPTINFECKRDASNRIIGIDFAPDVLKVTDGIPDLLYIRYKKSV